MQGLSRLGIGQVINLRHGNHNRKVRRFRSLWLKFWGGKAAHAGWFWDCALRFYERAMRRRDAKLFVMCRHGICRSASLAYFLLRTSHRSAARAKALVLKAKP